MSAGLVDLQLHSPSESAQQSQGAYGCSVRIRQAPYLATSSGLPAIGGHMSVLG